MLILEIIKDATLTILIAVTFVNIRDNRTEDATKRAWRAMFLMLMFTL